LIRFIVPVAGIAVAIAAVGCGESKPPTGPTPSPRLSHTRFLAFGDSFTAGEVTNPTSIAPSSPIGKLVLVPSASYPAVLETRLRVTYSHQAILIDVTNAGLASERILDGAQRFPSVYDDTRPEVVLLQEGANGLPQVGPDISTGVMRTIVHYAKDRGSRVFVGSMLPQVPGRPRGNTPVSELLNYNATLQLMAQQEGVVFVDLYNAMLPDAASVIGSDGLHPNEAGYRFIAQLFFEAIRRELEQR
jgi:lysophospholipase L1-like esterase